MPRVAAAVTCYACLVSHATPGKTGLRGNTPEAMCLRLRPPNFRQLVSVAMLPAALRAISPKAVTICSMFSGA